MKNLHYNRLDKISIFFILAIIVLFYYTCYTYAYNFFYQDDFHLLRFVTLFNDDSLNFQQKFSTLYNQHNEHRIIFPRLFVLLDYYIQGHLDWKVMNVVSALYYVGIFTFFALIVRKIKLSVWYIIPIALLIFQPSSHQNFYWTISILQQVGNLFWAMFVFYSLIYFNTKNYWISLLLMIVLTYTHGNGLFGFVVGGMILFFQQRYKHLYLWIAMMALVIFLYFYGYFTAQNSNVLESLSNPTRLIGCFGGFWGGFIHTIFSNNFRLKLTIVGGLLMFITLTIINVRIVINHFLKKFQSRFNQYFPQENLFLFACFVYLFITAALVALSRSWTSIEAGFQNRYLHNSVFALVLLYVTLLHYKSERLRKIIGIFVLFFGLLFNLFSWYSTYEFLVFQYKSQEADEINYVYNKTTLNNDKTFNQNISEILQESFEKGISVLPQSELKEAFSNKNLANSKQHINYQIDIKMDSLLESNISSSHYRLIYQLNNVTLPYGGEIFIVMKSPQHTFISATSHRRNAKIAFLRTGQFFTDGFLTTIVTDAMPKNVYELGILQHKDQNFVYFPTRYKIQTR